MFGQSSSQIDRHGAGEMGSNGAAVLDDEARSWSAGRELGEGASDKPRDDAGGTSRVSNVEGGEPEDSSIASLGQTLTVLRYSSDLGVSSGG